MIITQIVFTRSSAERYGLDQQTIGQAGCGCDPEKYCANVMGDVISINGYTTYDFVQDNPDTRRVASALKAIVAAAEQLEFNIVIDE